MTVLAAVLTVLTGTPPTDPPAGGLGPVAQNPDDVRDAACKLVEAKSVCSPPSTLPQGTSHLPTSAGGAGGSFGLLLWRDWSRMAPPSGLRVAGQVGAMVTVVLVLVLALAARMWALEPWLMAGASVALTGVLGLWRWRRLARAPAAWPAARDAAAVRRGETPPPPAPTAATAS